MDELHIINPELIASPEWLIRMWPRIIGAGGEIGGAGDLPSTAPPSFPVFYDFDDWEEFKHKRMYAEHRGFGDGDDEHMAWEFQFGSFAVFRVPKEVFKRLNEGYEESAGMENERIIPDGDHTIVVYMK